MRAKYLLGIVAFLPSFASSAVFGDDFGDGVTDPGLWNTFSNGPMVLEQNGRVEIAISSSAAGETFGAGYLLTPKLVGDFEVTVDFEHPLWPAANGVRSGLAATVASGFLTVERTCLSTAGGEYMLTDINHALTLAGYAATAGKMRIVRIGGLLTGYYWDGGWQPLATWAGGSDAAEIQIWSWSHDAFFGHQDSLATFDNFVARDSVPEVPVAPALLVGLAGLARIRSLSRLRSS